MKLLVRIACVALALFVDASLANGSRRRDDGHPPSQSCAFTLSATDSHFSRPVGQLGDGALWLNGPQPPAVFLIDGHNSITDSYGFSCSRADGNGIQCQSGKSPLQQFAIDPSFSLLYNSSSQFYACPGNDNGYGIFVRPKGDEGKCISTTLKTNSSCAIAGPPPYRISPSGALPSTVWQTSTVTARTTQTISVLSTVCDESSGTLAKSTHRASIGEINARDVRVLKPLEVKPSQLDVIRAPQSSHALFKRNPGYLNERWKYVRDKDKDHVVKQDQCTKFQLDMESNAEFVTAEYYGCTIVVIVGKGAITIGHFSQLDGKGRYTLKSGESTGEIIVNKLERMNFDLSGTTCDDVYVVITGSVKDNHAIEGIRVLKDFFADMGVRAGNLRYIYYEAGQPTAEFGDPTTYIPVRGRSYFEWTTNQDGGTMKVYLGHEEPRLVANFNKDWTPSSQGPTFTQSDFTTDGNF